MSDPVILVTKKQVQKPGNIQVVQRSVAVEIQNNVWIHSIGRLVCSFIQNGTYEKNKQIPGNVQALTVKFQSAARDTCPNTCESNIVVQTVQ